VKIQILIAQTMRCFILCFSSTSLSTLLYFCTRDKRSHRQFPPQCLKKIHTIPSHIGLFPTILYKEQRGEWSKQVLNWRKGRGFILPMKPFNNSDSVFRSHRFVVGVFLRTRKAFSYAAFQQVFGRTRTLLLIKT
jgi:hypothetical protein